MDSDKRYSVFKIKATHMDAIELNERGKGGEEDEKFEDARERQEEEETSLIERSEEAEDDYDDIRSRVSPEPTDQSKTNEGFEYDEDDLSERIEELTFKKEMIRFKAIQALELATGVRFDASYGENSKNLIDHISDVRVRKRDGVLIALKYKGEKVVLTKEGKIDKRSIHKNKQIWEAIAAANEEYEGTADAVIDKSVGFSVSDEARESVRRDATETLTGRFSDKVEDVWDRDTTRNIYRELDAIKKADDNVEYESLEDRDEKLRYLGVLSSVRIDSREYRNRAEAEQDPVKKAVFNLAADASEIKLSEMEIKGGYKPSLVEGTEVLQEEAEKNDLTRLERFKKWAKENLVGVSAVAISVAGIVTTVVISGRNAVKKGAKAVGQFGKALANLAKKAGPAIAAILNVLAQVLTWGAKALEFLSRNLWIVALFLTYLVYDTVKGRMKSKN